MKSTATTNTTNAKKPIQIGKEKGQADKTKPTPLEKKFMELYNTHLTVSQQQAVQAYGQGVEQAQQALMVTLNASDVKDFVTLATHLAAMQAYQNGTSLALCRHLYIAKKLELWKEPKTEKGEQVFKTFKDFAKSLKDIKQASIDNYVIVGKFVTDDGTNDTLPKEFDYYNTKLKARVKGEYTDAYGHTQIIEIVYGLKHYDEKATDDEKHDFIIKGVTELSLNGLISPAHSVAEIKKACREWASRQNPENYVELDNGQKMFVQPTKADKAEKTDKTEKTDKASKAKKVEIDIDTAEGIHALLMRACENIVLTTQQQHLFSTLYTAINKAKGF